MVLWQHVIISISRLLYNASRLNHNNHHLHQDYIYYDILIVCLAFLFMKKAKLKYSCI